MRALLLDCVIRVRALLLDRGISVRTLVTPQNSCNKRENPGASTKFVGADLGFAGEKLLWLLGMVGVIRGSLGC